eukprot:gene10292-biopygen8655
MHLRHLPRGACDLEEEIANPSTCDLEDESRKWKESGTSDLGKNHTAGHTAAHTADLSHGAARRCTRRPAHGTWRTRRHTASHGGAHGVRSAYRLRA